MKVHSNKQRINIITLGCSKNVVDSEQLSKQLMFNDFVVTHDSNEQAEIVVVNTCGFINDAKQESIDTILRYVDAKAKGLVQKVFVMGCLSERYKDQLETEIQGIDAFYGVTDLPKIIEDLGAKYKKELLGERNLSTPKHYAYLKISEGCDRKCSFCAIPLIRGKHISKSIEAIVREAKILVSAGVKELILIAQDLNYYGIDLYGEARLKDLLESLSEISELDWIRLHYTYPINFSEDLLKLINEKPNICNYIDIPLQHISEPILKSMKRGSSEIKTRALIDNIKRVIPDVALRTTMIVGYPGETQADFEKLIDFIKEVKFDRLGVFTYSPEEDTAAFELKDDISEEIKQARMDEIMEVQEQISMELNEFKIGNTYKTLIDRVEAEYYVGRTEFDSPEVDNEVLIKVSDNQCTIGEFYDIRIESASAFDLYGNCTP